MDRPSDRTSLKPDRGSISLVCLLVVLLALIVSLSVSTLAVDRIRCSRMVADDAEALSVAEAGAEYTIVQVRQAPSYQGTGGPIDFGEGSFTTTVNAIAGGNIMIRSVGRLDTGRTKTVEVVMTQTNQPLLPDGAIVSNGGISLTGNASTHTVPATQHEGHIRTNGNIVMTGNSSVDGSAVAAGTVSAGQNVHCYDPDYPKGQGGGPALLFPSSDQVQSMANDWRNEALTGGTRGDITLNSKETLTINSPIYINGDISLSGKSVLNIVGNGKVYVTGNVSISGEAHLNNASTLVMQGTFDQSGSSGYKVTGDPMRTAIVSLSADATEAIKLTGNSDTSLMGLIYAARGGIKITGNGTIYGGLIAGSGSANAVSGTGNATINYPANLIQQHEILPRQMIPQSWLER